MSTLISITIPEKTSKALERLTDVAGAMQAAKPAMDAENELTVSHIQRAYLSFPKSGPAVEIGLRVQSNRLRSSLRASKALVIGSENGAALVASIGSNVKYAAAHEFGTGPFTIKAKTKSGLRFKIGDRWITKQEVNHPGLKARGFVQRGIGDRLPEYGEAIGAAMVAWMGGGK